MAEPFILLDDARAEGASEARLYRAPVEIVVARQPDEVEPALARIEALRREGHTLCMVAGRSGNYPFCQCLWR